MAAGRERFRSRRAQSFLQDKLVIIILAAVVLIFLIIIAMNYYTAMQESAAREGCRRSLELSQIKLEGLNDKYGNPTKINCNTNYLKFNTQDDEQIKREVANQMVDCWDTYLKGEKEIFDTKDNTYCVVCSRLEFAKKTEIPQFTEFLASNKIPVKGKTYLEYLQGVQVADYVNSYYENSELSRQEVLSTKEPIAVMFVMGKNAFPNASYEGTKTETTPGGFLVGGATATGIAAITAIAIVVGGTAACGTGIGCIPFIVLVGGVSGVAGAGVGTVAGYMIGSTRSADWNSWVTLWPYDRLNEMKCTYMESKAGQLQIREVGNETAG
jgi:hypothetical protein